MNKSYGHNRATLRILMSCAICVLLLSSCYSYYHYSFLPDEVAISDWKVKLSSGLVQEGRTKYRPSVDPAVRAKQSWYLIINLRADSYSSMEGASIDNVRLVYNSTRRAVVLSLPEIRKENISGVKGVSYRFDNLSLPHPTEEEFDLSFQVLLIDSLTQQLVLDTSLTMHAKFDKHSELWVGH